MKSAAKKTLLGFLLVIAVGTGLLMLPVCSAWEEAVPFLDALFTATSATCVTGLIVLDTGSDFSPVGQGVILLLIQLGGLGIMTLSAGLLLSMGRRVSLGHKAAFAEDVLDVHTGDYRQTAKFILVLTLTAETAGALLLFPALWAAEGFWQGLWSSVFHSVSAFCNAGFSLYPDSLVRFQRNPWVNAVMGGLIVLGGIGFVVVWDLLGKWKSRKARYRLALHTKLVLTASAALIALGAAMILALEWNVSLAHLGWPSRAMAALFQSVTARTAGFNTVPIHEMSDATIFGIICLMFVGASPFSTGGGIKTTTLMVIVAVALSRFRGRSEPVLWGRSFSERVVTRAMTLTFVAALAVFVFTAALLTVERYGAGYAEGGGEFLGFFFESVSAFATVGLSLGATGELGPGGKVLVTLLMYIGRVGPLALVAALSQHEADDPVRYPPEEVSIG